MLAVGRLNVDSMIGNWQMARLAVLATVAAIVCMTSLSGNAAGDDTVSTQCAERPTPTCLIAAGVSTMRSMAEQPDAFTDVLMGRILNSLVHARIAVGDMKAAYALAGSFRDMKEPNVYHDVLDSIATAEARTGNVDQAARLLDSLKEDSRAGLLIAIADRQATDGHKVEARRTLDSALDSFGAIRLEGIRVIELLAAAKVMVRLGDSSSAAAKLREARTLADEISQEVFRSFSLSAIASTHAEMGDFDTALATARSIPRNSFRAGALATIAREADRQKKAIDAYALVAEALEVAREDTFPPSRANSLGGIAAVLSSLDNHTAARSLMEEALRTAQAAKGLYERAGALHAVAVAFARTGNPKRGLEIAVAIDLASERALAFFDMATALAVGY